MKKKLLAVLFLSCGIFLGTQTIKSVNASEIVSTSETSENTFENSDIQVEEEITSETTESTIEEEFDIGEWLSSIFTKEFIANLGSIGVSLLAVLKVAKDNKILGSQKITTPKEIAEMVKEELSKQEYSNFENYVEPLKDLVNTSIASSKTLAKIISLTIENTPQSRLAILELIESLGVVDKKVIEENKEKITEEVKAKEEKKNEAIKELDEISSEGRY